jgi:hypothetical protein
MSSEDSENTKTALKRKSRAALKSGNIAGQATDDEIYAMAHFFPESGASAAPRLAPAADSGATLLTRPPLDGTNPSP